MNHVGRVTGKSGSDGVISVDTYGGDVEIPIEIFSERVGKLIWDGQVKNIRELEPPSFIEQREMVNHPRHYNAHGSGVETIEICELLSFTLGNALKYVWRAGEKDDRKQDLKKAVWYLQRFYRSPSYNPGIDNYRVVTKLAEKILAVEGVETVLGFFLKSMIASPLPDWPLKIVDCIEREILRLHASGE